MSNQRYFPFSVEFIPAFLCVAENMSISAAAKCLHMSQPSISATIKRLEKELGITLFNRSANGVILTSDGLRFLDHAKTITSAIHGARDEFTDTRNPTGSLIIAASTTVSEFILPPIIGRFIQRYPSVNVTLLVKNTRDVIQLIRHRDAGIGFVEGYPHSTGLLFEKFIEDQLVLITSPHYAKSIKTIDDLKSCTLLIREPGSGLRSVVEAAFGRIGIHIDNFNRTIEMGSTTAIKQAVATGVGIGFASRLALANELRLQLLTPIVISGLEMTRTLSWCLPSEGRREIERLFIKFARAVD
ncbi:LysR family transcriptional regulator [bacterium]|nr:LysR family transcriptional regulator [bacterium]